MEEIFGELTREEAWMEEVAWMYRLIEEEGVLAALDAVAADEEIVLSSFVPEVEVQMVKAR